MKIYSGDTWTLEELQDQVVDAGRRSLLVPAADSKKAVLAAFGEALDFPDTNTMAQRVAATCIPSLGWTQVLCAPTPMMPWRARRA